MLDDVFRLVTAVVTHCVDGLVSNGSDAKASAEHIKALEEARSQLSSERDAVTTYGTALQF